MTKQDISHSANLPENIGKYRITRLLGRGATSLVYKGVDPDTFKLVAIKKIRFDGPLRIQKKMFEVEASLIGKLNHPNIVALYEAQTADPDNTYIVMEYVDGIPLDRYSSPDSLLPLENVIDVIRQCAEALNYAFHMGVIHRDVKPANILMRQDGLVKLTDFGCALVFDTDTTQIGIAGSLNFMSPELLENKPLNHQSDIYSIGAVLYRLLTGKNPYKATDSATLIEQITTQPHIPIEHYRADLPIELCRIIDRALQKKLSDRYHDWTEFLSDLSVCAGIVQDGGKIDDHQKFNLLSSCAFFKDFAPVEIWEVLRASQWRNFNHNEDLMKEDEHGFSIFILLEGSAVITKKHRMLNIVQVGDCVGESSCLYHGNPIRSATVTAKSNVYALEVSKERLEGFSKEVSIRMDHALLRSLSRKLDESNARILQLMGI